VPKKILLLITELDVGGAERFVWELARRLPPRDLAVEVAALAGRGEVGRWLEEAGIPVHYLQMRGKLDLAGVLARTVGLLKARRPHLLHTLLFHANLVGRLAAALAGVSKVVSSVRVAERRRRSHLVAEGATQCLVTRFVAVSQAVRSFMIRRAGIAPDKIMTIPNGVEVSRFARGAPVGFRSQIGARDGEVLVTYVGRLERQKGVDVMLCAGAKALRHKGDLRFLVVGAGPDRSAFEVLAARLGIAGHVDFLGWRPDVPDILAASDIFVLPSRWEGMPNALLEAMASGTASVASDVEGVRELIEPGRSGLVVLPGDADALAGAVVSLARDEGLRKRLGAAARRSVTEHFDIGSVVQQYVRLYEELLAGAH